MADLEKMRENFPVTRTKTFLNHAAMSPVSKPVAGAMKKLIDEATCFDFSSEDWEDCGKPYFAQLINARTEEIARIENTSMGMNIAAHVIQAPRGAKIVTTDLEYPSVTYPFLRKSLGLNVHYVRNINGKILLEDMEKAVDDKTVAIAVSHVEYANGFRHDLRAVSEIAHRHGAYLIVDAIQAAGAISVDVKRDGVDFLASACYKWLMGPSGAGYLYVRKELIEKFEPPFVGWASVKPEVFETTDFWDIWKPQYSENASRFEAGSPSIISFAGARAAIKLLLDVGIDNIEKRILELTDYLINELQNAGFTLQTPEDRVCRGGIVNFKVENPQKMQEQLAEKGIMVTARASGIRVSPHFYNTKEEIDRLVEEAKKIEKQHR
ncbi:aminotransferase class V-fold PLP-dependent enzyme [Candidatus Bathyarchaeota archaeon]|nr:aminotransferase class V-fold PLP-dependent enzyme [Candidatus Bathyarchaeota archaeon]